MAKRFGPRVIGFGDAAGPNVFAELGDLGIELPDGRKYSLRGGHRLWAAPEVPEVTYEPDDEPVVVTEIALGLELGQPVTGRAALEKKLELTFVPGARRISVSHTLLNRNDVPVAVAPWAITQLPVGGTALVPLRRDLSDAHGYQPNTSIAIWPYTGVADNPFALHDRMMVLQTTRATPTKVGTSLHRGWLAYVHSGLVFVKRAHHVPEGTYIDLGASSQCYCCADFVELETLGPLTLLEPGAATTHVETWELHHVDLSVQPEDIPRLLDLDEGTAQ